VLGDVQISTAKYTFFTDNSLYKKDINNILIPLSPLETQLEPDQDYWVRASLNNPNRMTFQYQTKIVGDAITPEPATMFLMAGGLVGAFWRRRKVSKVKELSQLLGFLTRILI
jgi:PEP-CTERM motif